MRIPFLKLPRFTKTRFAPALLCLSLNWIVGAGLQAQTETDPFLGNWAVVSESSDPVIILLKPNGEASYFNAKGSDRTVYQGNWSSHEGTATAQWADGSEHRFRQGAFDLVVSYSNAEGAKTEGLTAKAVPEGILGQWAKPPARADADSEVAQDNFFGLWKLKVPRDGKEVFVMVSKDRSAATNVGGMDASGLHGSWIKQGSELHLVWENGDYSILRVATRGHDYTRISAGAVIEDASRDFQAIARLAEDLAPVDWMRAYRAEQEQTPAGYIFSSRKEARNFYRGDWLIQHAADQYERITIRKYGGLETSRDRNLHGDWLLSGQNVMLRWDDGMRKILSPAGRGFVYYSYIPGQPLDGVPTRILPATIEDSEKMASLQAGRKTFSEALLVRAQAAGIQIETQSPTGPMDWTWPFGRKNPETSEALVQGEGQSEAGLSNDPWWWPLWSETTPESTAEENTSEATPTLDPPAESAELDSNRGPKPLRQKKGGWYWPF